jgi:hypothetical protein
LTYSQQRLTSISDEWRREYPALEAYAAVIARRAIPFRLDSLPIETCEKFAYDLIMKFPHDEIALLCEEFYTGTDPNARFVMLEAVIRALYHVGIASVKLEPHLPRQWSSDSIPLLSEGQLKPSTLIDVHKTFHAALGVSPRARAT